MVGVGGTQRGWAGRLSVLLLVLLAASAVSVAAPADLDDDAAVRGVQVLRIEKAIDRSPGGKGVSSLWPCLDKQPPSVHMCVEPMC